MISEELLAGWAGWSGWTTHPLKSQLAAVAVELLDARAELATLRAERDALRASLEELRSALADATRNVRWNYPSEEGDE